MALTSAAFKNAREIPKQKMLEGHVLGSAKLTGIYERKAELSVATKSA